jgi:hypothetical protein
LSKHAVKNATIPHDASSAKAPEYPKGEGRMYKVCRVWVLLSNVAPVGYQSEAPEMRGRVCTRGEWRGKFHLRNTTEAIGELYTNKIPMQKGKRLGRSWEEIFEVGAVMTNN